MPDLMRQGLTQGHLFDQVERQRQAVLDRTIDTIRGQLGHEAIKRGSLLDRSGTEDEGRR